MNVFKIGAILFLICVAIVGGVLGFSASSSHGVLVRLLLAIFTGIAAVFTVLYAFACIVSFIEQLLRGFRKK